MSELTSKVMRGLTGQKAAEDAIAKICEAWNDQSPMATLAATILHRGIADHAGNIKSAFVLISAPMGAGESCVFDITKNGVSLGTLTIDTETADLQHELTALRGMAIAKGDIIRVVRTYVAGGAPTAPANTVHVEWA
jgi:hypothetical protein